jgi:hypothetical protein
MKKVFAFVVGLVLLTSLAFAQDKAPVAVNAPTQEKAAGETLTLKGDIIDNLCAGSQSPESLSSFVKTHTKMCALAPSCVESGYSIFADGKLMKFDKASNAKIAEFLNKEDSKLQVVVEAIKVGEELSLISIKNQ